MLLLQILTVFVVAQNTTIFQPSTSRPSPTTSTSRPSPTGTSSPGTQEERARACTEGSTTLVNAYKQCFPLFPFTAPSILEADTGATSFIRCLCATEWRAGSTAQLRSSIPVCPAIPGITKGQQAAVAADCGSASFAQQGRIVQNFGLRTFVGRKAYVPLSGLPPGVTSLAVQHVPSYLLLLFLIY